MNTLRPNENADLKALRASELRYRRLFESARDGVLILDADTGMVVDVNPFLVQLLGLSHEDFLGRKVWDLGLFKDIAANAAKFAELQAKDYVRYEDLPLETADGRKIEVEFVSNVYLVNGQRVIQCNIRDITERKRTERLAGDVLSTLNRPNNTKNIIRDILKLIKERTGIEAVGIRLKAGEDFPYYQTNGFPDDFVQSKHLLCARDAAGEIRSDGQGHPVLECMCGNVLCGRTDARLPYFTAGGSFWTNSATDWLAAITGAERRVRTLNRCHGAGYESVAMIPLRAGTETIGLLQLLDHRRDQFTTELITVLEWLGASVGVALTRMRAEDAVRALSSRQEAILAAVPDIIMEVDVHKVYTWANRAGVEFFGADVIGREAAFYFEGEQETLSNVQPLFTGDERMICVESWQRRKDGEKRLLAWWCRTLKDAQGTVIGVLSTAH
ncbi:MAG: PAS domain S-box protein, partial [Candidatus Omnitrophica bacterium]|nr:PAS domain S-box protein [Candidatus Omnitrophota bacterium]